MSIAYYNGDFCDFSQVRIPLSDRCVFFGDGVYDAAIGKNGRIYLEKEHLDRFFTNARKMGIPIKMSREELSSLMAELIAKNGFREYFIYLQLTRFSEERTHSYPDTEKSNLLITVKEHTLPNPDKELSLITVPDVRYSMCDVKTLNLLPAVLASRRACESGCDEAVFVRDGYVTECAHSNIHVIKDKILYTHPNGKFILPGITRARLLYFCEKLGIVSREVPFTPYELKEADEVLVTSTTKLCLKAGKIDEKNVGKYSSEVGKKLIFALREDFFKKLC